MRRQRHRVLLLGLITQTRFPNQNTSVTGHINKKGIPRNPHIVEKFPKQSYATPVSFLVIFIQSYLGNGAPDHVLRIFVVTSLLFYL